MESLRPENCFPETITVRMGRISRTDNDCSNNFKVFHIVFRDCGKVFQSTAGNTSLLFSCNGKNCAILPSLPRLQLFTFDSLSLFHGKSRRSALRSCEQCSLYCQAMKNKNKILSWTKVQCFNTLFLTLSLELIRGALCSLFS